MQRVQSGDCSAFCACSPCDGSMPHVPSLKPTLSLTHRPRPTYPHSSPTYLTHTLQCAHQRPHRAAQGHLTPTASPPHPTPHCPTSTPPPHLALPLPYHPDPPHPTSIPFDSCWRVPAGRAAEGKSPPSRYLHTTWCPLSLLSASPARCLSPLSIATLSALWCPTRALVPLQVEGKNPVAMDLAAAYRALWNGGYVGGFSWSWERYSEMDAVGQALVKWRHAT